MTHATAKPVVYSGANTMHNHVHMRDMVCSAIRSVDNTVEHMERRRPEISAAILSECARIGTDVQMPFSRAMTKLARAQKAQNADDESTAVNELIYTLQTALELEDALGGSVHQLRMRVKEIYNDTFIVDRAMRKFLYGIRSVRRTLVQCRTPLLSEVLNAADINGYDFPDLQRDQIDFNNFICEVRSNSTMTEPSKIAMRRDLLHTKEDKKFVDRMAKVARADRKQDMTESEKQQLMALFKSCQRNMKANIDLLQSLLIDMDKFATDFVALAANFRSETSEIMAPLAYKHRVAIVTEKK